MSQDNTNLDLRAFQAEQQVEANLPVEPMQVASNLSEDILDEVDMAVAETKSQAMGQTAPGSLQRKWVEAMSGMASSPVSYGAIAGTALAGIFGGSQAGAAAAQTGMQFNQMANQRYMAEQRANALGARQAAQGQFASPTGFVLKGTTTPVLYNKQSGEFTLNGKVVSPDKVENVQAVESGRKSERAEKNIERRDRSLDQKDVALGLSKDRLDLATEQFIDKQDEDVDKKKLALVKQIEANPVYKKSEDALVELATIKSLLADAYSEGGQSLAMLGPKIAKGIAGEVGVLTEQDVTRYVKNPAVVGGLVDTYKKMVSGKISEASKENIERLLDIMEKESVRKQQNVIDKIGSRYAKTTKDITKADAEDIFSDAVPKAPSPTDDTTLMIDPNGNKVRIKNSQLQKAFKMKYRRAK